MADFEFVVISETTTVLLDHTHAKVAYTIEEYSPNERPVTVISRRQSRDREQKQEQGHKRSSSWSLEKQEEAEEKKCQRETTEEHWYIPSKTSNPNSCATPSCDGYACTSPEHDGYPDATPTTATPTALAQYVAQSKERHTFVSVAEIVWPSWVFSESRMRFGLDRGDESEESVVGVRPSTYFQLGRGWGLCDHTFVAPNGTKCTWTFVRGGLELRDQSSPPIVLARYHQTTPPAWSSSSTSPISPPPSPLKSVLSWASPPTNTTLQIMPIGHPLTDTIIMTVLHVERYGTHKIGSLAIVLIVVLLVGGVVGAGCLAVRT